MSKSSSHGSKTPGPGTPGSAPFLQFAMPFWQMLLETDTPGFVFQPVKAMALGQIQTLDLINKRCLACFEFQHKLAACRTPEDFMREYQQFFQAAMSDYSDAIQAMSRAWDNAVAEQTNRDAQTEVHHDYLPLSDDEPAEDVVVELHTDASGSSRKTSSRERSHGNGVADQVSP